VCILDTCALGAAHAAQVQPNSEMRLPYDLYATHQLLTAQDAGALWRQLSLCGRTCSWGQP
jgi:hypothetical protein